MSAKTLILGTAGHIDHGKTALVRALTGIDTDRLPQEKRRGMTIDIGFAELQLDDCQLGIIDVPGHERFVKNMLAGATAIDMGMLVVAADDGVMPQTREHMAILDLLGIEQGVIAMTKCDLRGDDWLELVDDDIRQLVAGTGLEQAEIVRTAVPPDGPPQGLDRLCQALAEAARRVPGRPPSGQFRMSVDRSFSVAGRGTVVTGTVCEGCVAVGESLERLPAGDLLKVRGLENHGRQVDSVRQGQRAAINFSGVHYQEIERGQVLATPGYLRPARWLTVALQVMRESPWPIKHRSRYSLHIGTQLVSADLHLYGSNQLAAGESAVAQLHCQLPVTTVWGAPFILRQESPQVTLGGGRVLQPTAQPIRRRRTDLVAKQTALKSNVPAERIAAATYFFRMQPWTLLDLCRSSGVEATQAEPIVEQLVADGEIVSLTLAAPTTIYIHAEIVAEAERAIQRAVDGYHQAHPLSLAMPKSQLHVRLADRLDRSVCDTLIDRLCAADQLKSDKESVARAGFRPELGSKYEDALASIDAAFESGRFEPPALDELAEAVHLSIKEVRKLIELRVEQGLMVAIESDLFLSRKWEMEMQQLVSAAFTSQEGLTVSQIRDVLRSSRKFAVPLCEYLDRIGFTRRKGDLRMLN